MIRLAVAALALALPGAAIAAGEGDSGETKGKKICRTEKVTGSLTRVNRVCLTREQWDALHADTREKVNNMQRSASGGLRIPDNPVQPAN